jgi:hypothetical protein
MASYETHEYTNTILKQLVSLIETEMPKNKKLEDIKTLINEQKAQIEREAPDGR